MSKITKIPSEIVSLLHHVKLNESGWWEKVVHNLIFSAFLTTENATCNSKDISTLISREYGVKIESKRFERQLQKLINKGLIKETSSSFFQVKNEYYQTLKEEHKKQINIEEEAKSEFLRLFQGMPFEIDGVTYWPKFIDLFINPVIKEIGAKIYEFISGQRSEEILEYRQYNDFISLFPKKQRNAVKKEIVKFFQTPTSKPFILHQLNLYFFLEATNLDEVSLEKIYSLSSSQTSLRIFVDTNLLLSILDLHDNPSNEAAMSLLKLLGKIKNKVQVKFYILPITIREFQNLIHKNIDKLKRIRPTLSYAITAIKTDEFSGLIRRYFEKCVEQKKVLLIDDYFGIYTKNIIPYLKKNYSIEIYNQKNIENYSTDQRVIDDLMEQVDYRVNKVLENYNLKKSTSENIEILRTRFHDKFNHDCQMWHIVKDLRPNYVESPKDVKNWIGTLDFSFLSFDRYKQKSSNWTEKVGVCLHPNELISMFQFWVPRSSEFESAVLENFQLPFLFKDIDTEGENISIEILSALSLYESSSEYSEELVAEILTNEALRNKIETSNSVEENAKLIKDEILKEYEYTNKKLNEKTNQNNKLVKELNTVKDKVLSLEQSVDSEKRNVDIREKKIEELFNEQFGKILATQRQIQNTAKIENLKSYVKVQEERLNDLEELKDKLNKDVKDKMSSASARLKTILWGKKKVEDSFRKSVFNKLFNEKNYQGLKEKIENSKSELKSLEHEAFDETIIIFCENKNAVHFNSLNLSNIKFMPANNSHDLYTKIRANAHHFGIRDRDYLTDNEVTRLRDKYKNYYILEYYCFENYLYHPDNLDELLDSNGTFDINEYKNEIAKQKEEKYDSIIANIKLARKSYEELKINSEKIADKNIESIFSNLKSDKFESYYKYFDMKTKFNKEIVQKFNLSEEKLTSTAWFRNKILNLINKD